MKEQEYKIQGMSCQHCVMAVETELKEAGFNKFSVEVGSAKVECDGSEASENKIKSAIEEAGYKVVN